MHVLYYLITWNFRHVNFAILRFVYFATVNFAIFRKFCVLSHFNFALWVIHDLFPWKVYVTSPWLKQKDKKLYISTNQVAWISFKNTDRLYMKADIHIFKVKSTFHLLLDLQTFCNTLSDKNPFFLDYLYNVSPNFRDSKNCEIREINVSRKFHVIR